MNHFMRIQDIFCITILLYNNSLENSLAQFLRSKITRYSILYELYDFTNNFYNIVNYLRQFCHTILGVSV